MQNISIAGWNVSRANSSHEEYSRPAETYRRDCKNIGGNQIDFSQMVEEESFPQTNEV